MSSPQTLTGWHDQLKALKLPADPQVKIAALQKLKASTGNADNVAAILQEDPGLCLVLMHEANKTLNRNDNETTSLSHTVSLLGFPYVETILRRTPDYDKKTFPGFLAYRQQLSISLHAAYQVEAWAQKNPYWAKGELFWATVFQRSAYWVLWYQAHEKMLQLQQLQAQKNGISNGILEEQVFGCKLQELSRLLSRNWNLPKVTQQSWQTAISGSARQWISLSHINPEQSIIAMEQQTDLRMVSGSIPFAIALANQFACETEWNWYSRKTLRLQKILANSMHIGFDQAIRLTHQQAVEASRSYNIVKTVSPAVQLFGYFEKSQGLGLDGNHNSLNSNIPSVSQKKVVKKSRGTPSVSLADAPRELTVALSRLKHRADSFVDQAELFEFALTTLDQTIGFKRATVSTFNRQEKLIRNRYSFGSENDPAWRNFRHQVKKGDLFSKLLRKTLSVHLNNSNRVKIESLLSPQFNKACNADEFLMMSIFNGTRAVAIIYADNFVYDNDNQHDNTSVSGENKIAPQQYFFFKQLCGGVSQCLQNMLDS